MTFQTIEIPVAGGSYQDRSRPLSSQETRNFYQEVVPQSDEQFILKSFAGQKLLGSVNSGEDRGSHNMNEVCYRVVGSILYSVNKNGHHSKLGSIYGSERCIFADDGINLFINTDNQTYHYNSSIDNLSLIDDEDINGAQSVAFINNQFAYTFPDLTVFSNVGDGSNTTSLNAVGEESNPDKLVRDYVHDQILIRFGHRSIVNWYNSGVGTPPFSRIEGQTINIGLAAKHSITKTRDYVYFLGSDRQIYKLRGSQEQVISTAALSGEIQSYSVVDDAFSEVISLDNKQFVLITFPTANKTWCLNEELGLNGWFELSEGITDGRYNINSVLNIYGKVLAGDKSNGNLYELDFNTYDQAGETWRRRRVLSSINGKSVGRIGKRIQMSRFELLLETGVGLISGQGSDPKIMIEASYDGGRTWKTGTWMRIGRLGEYNIKAEWFCLDSFYDLMIRLTTSDPVPYNIYAASIDVKLAGR